MTLKVLCAEQSNIHLLSFCEREGRYSLWGQWLDTGKAALETSQIPG